MVRINRDVITRCSSRHLLPQNVGDIFTRVTHLYMQVQNIRVIENLELCRNLLTLYLYDNRIEEINNLGALKQLECLYLQNNKIQVIKNLVDLTKLTVLNLAGNQISVVTGLDTLTQLRDLFLENQRLPSMNKPLYFDQDSILAISKSLKTLNISGNQIPSINALRPLTSLETFVAENNLIWNVQETADIFGRWKKLKIVKLNGNPLCKVRKYQDSIVVNCLELEELDGKSVASPYRDFLLNWKQSRDLKERKKKSYEIMKPFLNLKDKTDVPLVMPRSSSEKDISSVGTKLPQSRARSSTRRK